MERIHSFRELIWREFIHSERIHSFIEKSFIQRINSLRIHSFTDKSFIEKSFIQRIHSLRNHSFREFIHSLRIHSQRIHSKRIHPKRIHSEIIHSENFFNSASYSAELPAQPWQYTDRDTSQHSTIGAPLYCIGKRASISLYRIHCITGWLAPWLG